MGSYAFTVVAFGLIAVANSNKKLKKLNSTLFFSSVVSFCLLCAIIGLLSFSLSYTMSTRQSTRNSRLTPASMRRIGGGYVLIQEQPHQPTRAANLATTRIELQRPHRDKESLRREIGHLRATKA